MKRIFLLSIFIIGCCAEPERVIYNLDPAKMFRVAPYSTIEHQDMKVSDLSKELQDRPSTRDIPILDGVIVGDVRHTKTWGWFVDDDIMQQVYKIKAEEDLRMTWADKLWQWLGL